jgi:hypothetical protein
MTTDEERAEVARDVESLRSALSTGQLMFSKIKAAYLRRATEIAVSQPSTAGGLNQVVRQLDDTERALTEAATRADILITAVTGFGTPEQPE